MSAVAEVPHGVLNGTARLVIAENGGRLLGPLLDQHTFLPDPTVEPDDPILQLVADSHAVIRGGIEVVEQRKDGYGCRTWRQVFLEDDSNSRGLASTTYVSGETGQEEVVFTYSISPFERPVPAMGRDLEAQVVAASGGRILGGADYRGGRASKRVLYVAADGATDSFRGHVSTNPDGVEQKALVYDFSA